MKNAPYLQSFRPGNRRRNVRKQQSELQIRPDGSKRQRVSRRGAGRQVRTANGSTSKSATRSGAQKGPRSRPRLKGLTMQSSKREAQDAPGRKPLAKTGELMKARPVRMTDEEWEKFEAPRQGSMGAGEDQGCP